MVDFRFNNVHHHSSDIMTTSGGVQEIIGELFAENVTAKIFRTAQEALKDNVGPPPSPCSRAKAFNNS
jgi:hypothetical protein